MTTVGTITVPGREIVATTVIRARSGIALGLVRFPAHFLMVLSHCVFTSGSDKLVQKDGVGSNRTISLKGANAVDWRKRYAIIGRPRLPFRVLCQGRSPNGRFLQHRPERSERCLNCVNCTKASPRCQSGKVCRRPSVKTMLGVRPLRCVPAWPLLFR